jgi:hypothetical protein
MEPTKAQLDAFIDGELSMTERQEIEAFLAKRPDLAAYVEQQSGLRRRLADAFAPMMDEAIPQRLRDAVVSSPVSARFRAAAWLRAAADNVARVPVVLRVAVPATALACGLLLGVWFESGPRPDFQTSPGGRMVAQSELAEALSRQLASAGVPQSGPRIGISFRNRNGQNCRSFLVPGGGASTAGVACREGGDWVVAALAAAPGQTPGAYQQAGADMPEVIRSAVSAMIDGEPFDAAAERAAREAGWKKR